MVWSDGEFCERVVRRCEELGRSQRQVLKVAGVAHDYLQTTPAHGRRIDTVEKVGHALDWNLADVMGLSIGGKIDAGRMVRAYRTAREATQHVRQFDDGIFCEILTTIYNLFVDREAGGQMVDEEYQKMLIGIFAEQMAAISKVRLLRRPPEPQAAR